ncbi:terminase small subunit [Streptococcus phage CHPC926]|uniref:Uncharacterized protein n=2 Tax=Piorkowskivirus TaxID=3044792 RepID=A0A191KBN0_9CAUD|nr:terminase small subunit [Streptococcus phage 9874]YP_010663625.1 terminase small subunit [Streptococcus phage CHPC926]AMQ65842.1 hypothetical protein P9874_01 [Streptococcus phage 9874]APC45866.1 hypothetical protein CHPC926_0044 [Streptococcus phage CHPC926]
MVKSKYETHVAPYFDDIFYWYSHDWTLERIASELGIAKSTIMLYKKENSDLSDLLKKAEKSKPRYIAIKAEAALRDKLKDREIEEVHQEQWVDKNGAVTKKHIKKIKKIIPADTTAIIFALKNTDPKRWNDRSQVELSGSVETNPYEGLSTEELKKLANL